MTPGNQIPSASHPRVSVIMPAYRASQYISEALESVFEQTFQDLEVIVVNDGSPDTPQLEAALRPYASRIRYFEQPNRGASAARNHAIRHSSGSLLALLDSDDAWLPEYLETQVQFLDQNPKAVAAVADVVLFGELVDGPVLQRWLKPGMGQLLSFEDMIRRKAGQLPSATVVRKEKAVAAGLFDEQVRPWEDIEFSMRVCFPDGAIGYTGQALAKYRRYGASTVANLSAREIASNEAKCLRLLGRKLPLDPAQRALVEHEILALDAELAMMDAYEGLSRREFEKAAHKLAQANRYYRDKRLLIARFCLQVFLSWTARLLLARKNARRTEDGNR